MLTVPDLVKEPVQRGGAALPGEPRCLCRPALDERGA